jgi:hypothetical protein
MNGGDYGEEEEQEEDAPEEPSQWNPTGPFPSCFPQGSQGTGSAPQTAEEFLAKALETLAAELNAKKDEFPTSGDKVQDALVFTAIGAAAGATGGVPGAAVGAAAGLVTAVYTSAEQEYRLERAAVSKFYQQYKIYQQMAKKEAAERRASNANSVQAGRNNIIVRTRQHGTFALRPFYSLTGQTTLGEFVYEWRGQTPLDGIRSYRRGHDGKLTRTR